MTYNKIKHDIKHNKIKWPEGSYFKVQIEKFDAI